MNVINIHGIPFYCLPPPFYWQDFFNQALTNPSPNLDYDKSQTIYFLARNSRANFAESVFVIDNYSTGASDWQTKWPLLMALSCFICVRTLWNNADAHFEGTYRSWTEAICVPFRRGAD